MHTFSQRLDCDLMLTLLTAASRRHRALAPSMAASSSSDDAKLIRLTERWVEGFVVGHDLCPFAAAVRRHTRYAVCRAADPLPAFESELRDLRAIDPAVAATTLVLLPGDEFGGFEALMELQPDVQDLADELGGPGGAGVQVLPFHPQATYAEEDELHDAFDFTTRSPVPMLHLLREADVHAAEDSWHARGGSPIQERNAAYMRGLGYDTAAAIRAAAIEASGGSQS